MWGASMSKIDNEIKKELLDYFSDKNAIGIYKNKKLNEKVNRRINELKISKKSYLNQLGFIYSSEDWGEKVTEKNIKEFLEKLYPNKLIPNISDICKKKMKVYLFINDYCVENRSVNTDYIRKLGFLIDNSYLESDILISKSFLFNPFTTNNKYNLLLIKELVENFDIKIAKIAKILGVSRQFMDQQMKRKSIISSFTLDEEDFEDDVQELLVKMIENYKSEYNSEDISIYIFGGEKTAVIYDYHGDKKCVIAPGGIIGQLLEEKGYYKYKKGDIELLEKVNSKDLDHDMIRYFKRWNGDESKCRIDNEDIIRKLKANAKQYNMKTEEYYEFIGLNYYTTENELEDKLYYILKNNLNSDGIVKIQNKLSNGKANSQRLKVQRYLRKLDCSLEEIAEKFGFSYKRIVDRGNTEEKYKKIINERYIVSGNKIYINSQDKFYNAINTIALNKNITLNEYIRDLGFIRVNRNELPEGYIEYEWQNDINLESDEILNKAKRLLKEISYNRDKVYLDTTSYEYGVLWKYAYLLNLKINELIEKLHYTREYKLTITKKIKNSDKKHYSIESREEIRRNEILRELENIEKPSKRQETKIDIIERNRKLPVLLKKLYFNKCQLCSEEERRYRIIEKDNDEEYVEVHHIKGLAESFNINDEIENYLDSYKNAIVVCCYHHKLLHLHHGGFKKLKLIDGKLCFESERGDTLEVVTNYHLEEIKQ